MNEHYFKSRCKTNQEQFEGLMKLHKSLENLAQAKNSLHLREQKWEYTGFAENEVKQALKQCQELAAKHLR